MAKRSHEVVVVAAVVHSVADGDDSIVQRDGGAVVVNAVKGFLTPSHKKLPKVLDMKISTAVQDQEVALH